MYICIYLLFSASGFPAFNLLTHIGLVTSAALFFFLTSFSVAKGYQDDGVERGSLISSRSRSNDYVYINCMYKQIVTYKNNNTVCMYVIIMYKVFFFFFVILKKKKKKPPSPFIL